MRHGRILLYSLLLFVQTGGLAIILWQCAPIYRRILEGPEGLSVGSRELILAALAVGLMQGTTLGEQLLDVRYEREKRRYQPTASRITSGSN
jgi:hypothetical protein